MWMRYQMAMSVDAFVLIVKVHYVLKMVAMEKK